MARNVEVKLRLVDPAATRRGAAKLATRPGQVEVQVDRYFEVDPTGRSRVKVRESDRYGLQLIRYHRPEATGVRTSHYELTQLTGPEDPHLTDLTTPVLTVSKRREVFWIDNVRVHLDEVEGLGAFLELEAVVDAEHSEEVCHQQVQQILDRLGLAGSPPLPTSYSDLLAAKDAS